MNRQFFATEPEIELIFQFGIVGPIYTHLSVIRHLGHHLEIMDG